MIRNAYPNTHSCYTKSGADCGKCKKKIMIGKIEYCAFTPPRCGLTDKFMSTEAADGKMCLFCKNIHGLLKSKKCLECLSTLELVNWEKQVLGNPIDIEIKRL